MNSNSAEKQITNQSKDAQSPLQAKINTDAIQKRILKRQTEKALARIGAGKGNA